MTDEPELPRIYERRFSENDVAPVDFVRSDWQIIKESGKSIVAATHTPSGVTRKLPAHWFRG